MKKTLLIMLISFILLSITASASFDASIPSNIELENGKKIFYMTPPEYEKEGYPQTGLYYNTDPPENIYLTRPYYNRILYFEVHNIKISNDGMYFAHFPIVRHGRVEESALEFYAEGKLIKEYKVLDLVKDESKLDHTSAGTFWRQRFNEGQPTTRVFDADKNTLTLTTIDEITYTFDITTGKIISTERKSNLTLIITTISAVVICISTSAFLIRRKKWKKKDFKN